MIPTNPKVVKQLIEQADRNIERGDWEDEFLPDDMVPKQSTQATADLLKVVGKNRLPKN